MIVLVAAALAASLGAQQPNQSIESPPGSTLVLQAKGSGVQIYSCANVHDTFNWTLKGPDAKLYDAAGKEIGTHFAGPTWKLADGSADGSAGGSLVQGELVASQPSPEADSVPWLLLRAKPGTGTGQFAAVRFIRRTETHGGTAPASGCGGPGDVDKSIRVPYSATYSFYAAAH
jgi:hypothetical protein